MAAKKYVGLVSGELTEVAGTVTSAGAGDDGKIVALDTAGKLDLSVMPTGVGPDTATIQASENLAASDLVNVHDSSGVKVRKADASGGLAKRTHGFVLSAVTSGQNALVYFEGTLSGLSGLTPGAAQFLAATPGARTETAPSTAAHISQNIGVAISATAISFEPQRPVVLA